MLPPFRAYSPAKANTSGVLVGGACIIGGWSFTETTGAATAEIALWDGGTGGQLLTDITLSSGQSTRDLIAGHGLRVSNQLWYQAVSGSVNASVWVVTLQMLDAFALEQGIRPIWTGAE